MIMTCPVSPAEEKYAKEFLGDLLQDPEITPDMARDLTDIAQRAYFTTFTDDSGLIHDGIKLSLLDKEEYKGTDGLNKSLTYFFQKGNWYCETYVIEFIGEQKPEDKIPLIIKIIQESGTKLGSIGYEVRNLLQKMDTPTSRRALEELAQ